MLPALLFGAGALMGGIYNAGQAYDNYRYWQDYYRNTGYRPRYPFRSGRYDYLRDISDSFYTSAYWTRYN